MEDTNVYGKDDEIVEGNTTNESTDEVVTSTEGETPEVEGDERSGEADGGSVQ